MRQNTLIKNFIWSIKELFIFSKVYVLYMIVESLVKGFLPVISLIFIKKIIDVVQYKTEHIRTVIYMLIFISIIQLCSEIILNIIHLKLNNFELGFDEYFQKKILTKVSSLDCKEFENSKTYDLINRTQYDANIGILGGIKLFFLLLTFFIGSLSYSIIIIKYNIFLFLITISVPILRFLYEKKYNLLEYETKINNTENNRTISYIYYILTNSENFKEIKLFGLCNFFIDKFSSIKKIYNSCLIKLNNEKIKKFNILSIFENIVDFVVTLFFLYNTFIGNMSIGNFILYNNSNDNLKENVISMLSQLAALYKNDAIITQIRNFFDLKKEEINNNGEIINEIQSIYLKNISYKYKNADKYALKNINLLIEKGELVILVGYNGSGKSTLIKIIMGIYNDYEGEIYVNGLNLKDVNLESYRKKVSVLFQNYIKFETTIKDNIIYGDIELNDLIKFNKLINDLKIREFNDNIEQNLGYQFNKGIELSLGQWQKLSLARALYKEADIYIYDEPNSSLDLVTESFVWDSICKNSHSKISVVIMHRFNKMIDIADKIIVLENGEILEVGKHKDLMKNNKIYKELYLIQKNIFSN